MTPSRRTTLWLAAALLLLVVLRLPGFRVPLDQDTGCYAYVGQVWARGGLPYREVWDHKPPAIYLIPAALTLVAGSASAAALRACAVAFGAGTLLLVFAIARRVLDERVGLVAAFVYALSSSGAQVTRETLQTEHAMVFFSLLAAWLLVVGEGRRLWWPWLLAGVSGGAAVMFKPVAAPLVGLVALWAAWREWAGEGSAASVVWHLALMGAGGLAVLAVFVGYFALAGGLDAFVGALLYNYRYSADSEFGAIIKRTGLAIALSRLRQLAPEQAWLGVLAACGLLTLVARRRARAVALVLCWCAGAALGSALTGRCYAYYFLPLSAALAPLAALSLVSVWEGFRAAPAPRWADARHALCVVLLVLLGGASAWRSLREHRMLTSPEHTNVALSDMAREIRETTREDDRIFVWGTRQQVYVLSGRRAATRYIYDVPFRDREAARRHFGEGVFEELVAAVREARCPYIVVTDVRALVGFDALVRLLATDYEEARRFQGPHMVTVLYRLKGFGVEGDRS